MPLNEKGQRIRASMIKQYGPEKGKEVFYASVNSGKITGVEEPYGRAGATRARRKRAHR